LENLGLIRSGRYALLDRRFLTRYDESRVLIAVFSTVITQTVIFDKAGLPKALSSRKVLQGMVTRDTSTCCRQYKLRRNVSWGHIRKGSLSRWLFYLPVSALPSEARRVDLPGPQRQKGNPQFLD
jgi:hypothetical protein